MKSRGTSTSQPISGRLYSRSDLRTARIEVSPLHPHKKADNANVIALGEEAARVPLLRLVRSNQQAAESSPSSPDRISEKIDRNSFGPATRGPLGRTLWHALTTDKLSSQQQQQRPIDEMLRRTFRPTATFSSKNIADLRQSSSAFSTSAGKSKRKFNAVLHERSKSISRLQKAKSVRTLGPRPVSPDIGRCLRIVDSVMRSHRVHS